MSVLPRVAAVVTMATIKDWAQTIVLVGSVVVSCVVLVFKIGGYTQRLESAIADATSIGRQAAQDNGTQQRQIDLLITAETRRATEESEDRADARRDARRSPRVSQSRTID